MACKLSLSAVVYNIWKQRNAIIHKGAVWTEERVLALIKRDVKAKLGISEPCPKSNANDPIRSYWGLLDF